MLTPLLLAAYMLNGSRVRSHKRSRPWQTTLTGNGSEGRDALYRRDLRPSRVGRSQPMAALKRKEILTCPMVGSFLTQSGVRVAELIQKKCNTEINKLTENIYGR